MENATISVRHLFKNYGNVAVLNDISLDVFYGERVIITGPSGTGKSTLLRCLNLLENPDGGEIFFMGQNILAPSCNIQKVRQRMCMVFQQFNLFANFSVLENITLAPIKLLLKTETEAKRDAYKLLERFGLLEKASVFPHQLSGGQKQRVSIIRALAMQPDVLLFDEPTSALDSEMTFEVQQMINSLEQDKMTMVIITHDIGFAQNIATKIFSIQNCQLIPISP